MISHKYVLIWVKYGDVNAIVVNTCVKGHSVRVVTCGSIVLVIMLIVVLLIVRRVLVVVSVRRVRVVFGTIIVKSCLQGCVSFGGWGF